MRECGAKWREKRAVTLRGQAVPISTLTLRKKKKMQDSTRENREAPRSRPKAIASSRTVSLASKTRRARDVPACRLHFIAFLLTHDLHARRGGNERERDASSDEPSAPLGRVVSIARALQSPSVV